MSYTLNGTAIKAPNTMQENNSTQVAQQRTLSGDVGRDYFGSNKRIWTLGYKNCKKSAYDTINTIYQAYLTSGTAVTWVSDETNYAISSTTVHVDLLSRGFSVQGDDYISDFALTLTEA
jgi:hypothetical protein